MSTAIIFFFCVVGHRIHCFSQQLQREGQNLACTLASPPGEYQENPFLGGNLKVKN